MTADELVSKNMPTFIEGSCIEGEVKLHATKAETIHSVVVSVSDFRIRVYTSVEPNLLLPL